MTNLNKLIVSIPADKLVVSDGGRLDYPDSIPTCSGLRSDSTGEINKKCLCCIYYLTYFRNSYNILKWGEGRVEPKVCIKTPETVTVEYDFIDYFARPVDHIPMQNYRKYVLPVLEKLYGELI